MSAVSKIFTVDLCLNSRTIDFIYIYIYIIIVLIAQISFTLSYHLFLSSINLGRSPRMHPVSVQSWWICLYRSANTVSWCVGTHKRMSCLCFSSSAGMVLLGWFVRCEAGGRTAVVLWSRGFQDFFKTALSILELFPSSFYSNRFVKVQVVQQYSSFDMATAWKNSRFISSETLDIFLVANNLCLSYAYADIIFCRWDTRVCEHCEDRVTSVNCFSFLFFYLT